MRIKHRNLAREYTVRGAVEVVVDGNNASLQHMLVRLLEELAMPADDEKAVLTAQQLSRVLGYQFTVEP